MYEIVVAGSLGDYDGKAWCNGNMVPWRDIKLHAMAHGLHYASGVFDGIRVYNGAAFQLQEHIKRFCYGAGELLMQLEYDQQTLENAVRDVVKEREIETGYVRPIAWRGAGPVNFDPTPNPPNVAIFAWAFETFIPQEAKLVLSEWRRPSPNSGPWHIKATGNYLPATLQNYRSKKAGYNDALFLDWEGYVADTTSANIFLVIDGELHTPEPNGFFSGITRQTILNLANQIGIRSYERKISSDELERAQEAFLVGSAAGIVSIGSVDLKNGKPIMYHSNKTHTSQLQKQYLGLT